MKKKNIQILSVLSCFAVVVLHVNGCFWKFSYERYWITANVIECLFYFAVPIFFMISGVTLLDYPKRYSTKEFFLKRIHKAVIPFLIWSLIGLVWRVAHGTMNLDDEFTGFKLFSDILNTNIINIYWFFIPLFSVYLSIPLFAMVKEEKKQKLFLFLIIFSLIFNSLIPFVCSLLMISYNSGLGVASVSQYLIFVLLGYYIDRYKLQKQTRVIIYLLGIFGLFIQIFGTQIYSYDAGNIVSLFKGYTNIPCILYSVSIFTVFNYLNPESKVYKLLVKITDPFVKTTFGVYLTHWFLIQIVIVYMPISDVSILYRTLGAVIIFLLASGIVYLIQHIPVIKKIIPE